MINRAALILKYKQPAVDWINEVDPVKGSAKLTREEVNEDRTVYLISDDHADDPDVLEVWIRLNVEALLVDELNGWYQDESLWPKQLDYKLFEN